MRAAVIVDRKVDNIIEVGSLDVLPGVTLVEAPTASIGDTWDGEYFTPPVAVLDLPALKAAKREQVNDWRAGANLSSFPFAGKQIACDSLSRSDIDGVANSITLSGSFPTGFPMAWKATDNSYVMLPDLDAFKAMHAAMTAQGMSNFKHSQVLKAQIDAATTLEQIAAISW